MSDYTILMCRGIGEPLQHTMCQRVAERLPRDKFDAHEVPWPAQYGPVPTPGGASFETALAQGRKMLIAGIRASANPVILLGYSGGAALAGQVAAEIEQGNHTDLDVIAVGLIADPYQPADITAAGYGVAGSRPIRKIKTAWAWDARDPIPCSPEWSPLRTIADQTAGMSLADPAAWTRGLLKRLRTGRWQASAIRPWDLIGTLRAYGNAIRQAKFYLTGGHFDQYTGQHIESLAEFIEDATR